MKQLICSILLVIGLLYPLHGANIPFVINKSIEYQTMLGFGGGEYYTEYAKEEVDSLGCMVSRSNMDGVDRAEVQTDDSARIKGLHDAGFKYFIASVWNPSQFKAGNPPHIDHGLYNEFVDWFVGRIKLFKQQQGIELYAVSLQNEPAFPTQLNWQACGYTPDEMRDLIKLVGARLEAETLSTKIMWSEDVFTDGGFTSWRAYQDDVVKDSVANKYAYAMAVHGYMDDGVTPAALPAKQWIGIGKYAAANHKPLWMTETSGFQKPTEIQAAVNFGKWMLLNLKYGRVSLYNHHMLTNNLSTYFGPDLIYFITDHYRPLIYYSLKQFSRYIKEGAVQVSCTSSVVTLFPPVVFRDAAARTLTMVFVNDSAGYNCTFSGNDLPSQYHEYITNVNDHCRDAGMVSVSGPFAVPESSIVTLVAADPTLTSAVKRPAIRGTARKMDFPQGPVRIYSIDGRLVSVENTARLPAGIYCLSRDGMSVPAKIIAPSSEALFSSRR